MTKARQKKFDKEAGGRIAMSAGTKARGLRIHRKDGTEEPSLKDIRVLDLTRVLAGPYCTMLLGDMGAEVIKVEEPGKGDDTRAFGPPFVGGEAAYYLSVNRNKKSLTVNLKAREARGILRRLCRWADVLVENFRPGTMEKLGLDYETVKGWNPRLVYCSISGFGESGPDAGRPGYDLIVQGEAGLMDITGFPDGPPVKVGIPIADLVAGIMATHGIVLALLARHRTGCGQKVEIAMLDVVVSLLTWQAAIYFCTGREPTRQGNQHPTIVPYEVFKAADGHLTVGVANNSLWYRFCEVIDRIDLKADPRFDTESKRVENRRELIPIISAILARKERDEWIHALDSAGIPCGKIRSIGEVCTSPHLKARDMIVHLPHPTAGAVATIGIPIKLGSTPGVIKTAPPLLGEHNEEILRQLLRFSRAYISRLQDSGVV